MTEGLESDQVLTMGYGDGGGRKGTVSNGVFQYGECRRKDFVLVLESGNECGEGTVQGLGRSRKIRDLSGL
jgi:hypothetical protein